MSLDDWNNPLDQRCSLSAGAPTTRRCTPPPTGAAARRRRSRTPGSTWCRSACRVSRDEAFGLLLFAGRPQLCRRTCTGSRASSARSSIRSSAITRITDGDRKQGRERSLLHSIINAVTDPILLTDTEGRLLIANARALTLFTASEEESEGRRGAVRMNNMLLSSALSSKAIEETGAARRELLLVNPVDGSDLLFELLSTDHRGSAPRHRRRLDSAQRQRPAGAPARRSRRTIGSFGVAEAQARAESDRLNLIIDSVADPIVVTDAGGATSLMNEPAERLFTIPSRASAAEQRWVQANDAHFSSFIAGMLVSADQRRVGEIGLIDPTTGEAMPVEAIAGKILSDHGELNAVVTILHDRREALEKAQAVRAVEAGVRRARAQDSGGDRRHRAAERAAPPPGDRARAGVRAEVAVSRQHVARVPDAARTPCSATPRCCCRASPARSRRAARRQLGRIESNGRHLLTIINEILDISRIEAGRMPLQISTFRIPELVAEVKSELEPIILRSRLTLTLDLARDLKPISTDRQKVKQILLNLLSNALKFTHQGGVTISARRHQRERTIVLSVADTGIGIAPGDQDKIFEDFRQLDNSPTRAYGGTGLGLSICRRLAQMLGGRISVQSRSGRGRRSR